MWERYVLRKEAAQGRKDKVVETKTAVYRDFLAAADGVVVFARSLLEQPHANFVVEVVGDPGRPLKEYEVRLVVDARRTGSHALLIAGDEARPAIEKLIRAIPDALELEGHGKLAELNSAYTAAVEAMRKDLADASV